MALFGFRKMSFVTHGMQGWWWASRYSYPGDDHGVRIPVYGWVDAEAAEAAAVVARSSVQALLPEAATIVPASISEAARPIDSDDRIATFPIRA